MAHSLSAKKRIRQNEKRNARNRWRKNIMRESIKELTDKILHAPLKEAEQALKAAAKIIDRTASKGTIHKNQAARRKSRLAARIVARKKAGQVDAPPKKK